MSKYKQAELLHITKHFYHITFYTVRYYSIAPPFITKFIKNNNLHLLSLYSSFTGSSNFHTALPSQLTVQNLLSWMSKTISLLLKSQVSLALPSLLHWRQLDYSLPPESIPHLFLWDCIVLVLRSSISFAFSGSVFILFDKCKHCTMLLALPAFLFISMFFISYFNWF